MLAALAVAASPAVAAEVVPPAGGSIGLRSEPCRGVDHRFGETDVMTLRRAVRCLVNYERRRASRAPLRPDGRLNRAARRHALDMAHSRFFAHVSSNGDRLPQRIGAVSPWEMWHWVGEVLGWACTRRSTPRAIVDAWMLSPPHRAILISHRPSVVGIGAVRGTPFHCDGVTWTLELGERL